MSQTQISFAAFARRPVCPPAGASQEVNEAEPGLAALSASGQQAGTPLPYDGPYVPKRWVHGDTRSRGGRREDMWCEWQFEGLMDAPDLLPTGSHRALLIDGCGSLASYVVGDAFDFRPGYWS